jgi:hypothetical protein
MSGTFYLFFIQFLNHNLAERINSYEKEKNIYPLFGSSDDGRHHDGLFISAQARKYGRRDPENHDDNNRKTRTRRETDHHHDNRN